MLPGGEMSVRIADKHVQMRLLEMLRGKLESMRDVVAPWLGVDEVGFGWGCTGRRSSCSTNGRRAFFRSVRSGS